jgi:hypothetical protein
VASAVIDQQIFGKPQRCQDAFVKDQPSRL